MRHLWTLTLCLFIACNRQAPPPEPVKSSTPTPDIKTREENPKGEKPKEDPLLRPKETKSSRIPANARAARVRSIADGDTIQTSDGEKIRYIGIDTPERAGKDGKPEPFYQEAKDLNTRLTQGKELFLELDAGAKDKYGRTLAYIWVRDGDQELMVNAEILRAGFAYVYTLPPNVKHTEELLACQREARQNQRGMWKSYVLGGEEYYVGTARGGAYHRPSCKDMADRKDLKKYKDQSEALDAGRHPCRNCKP